MPDRKQTLPPLDHRQRLEALNPQHSYIVQAPAGSGKTELLTQRFLKLLAQVAYPEHVLAITFTRKAAREMTERIKRALAMARDGIEPPSQHAVETYHLARSALANDQRLGWKLHQNPNRLRIMTIDAFCMQLTQQLPIDSGLGNLHAISSHPQKDYLAASQQMLSFLEEPGPIRTHLMSLLSHLDHQEGLLIQLFTQLLAKRDQWLPIVLQEAKQPPEDLKYHLEETLDLLHQDTLNKLIALIPSHLHDQLAQCCRFAGGHLLDSPSPTALWHTQHALPDSHSDNHALWLGLIACLLTQDDQWRKTLDKRSGFPSNTTDKTEKAHWQAQKRAMMDVIEQLKSVPGLLAALKHARRLPPATLDNVTWEVLQALLKILPLLAAQCQIIFQQRQHVDYIEIASRALAAIDNDGGANIDTALALHLQLHHLLIDEFQDTSPSQFALVEALVNDWSLSDARTLFLVGDPMQSIYRFRQADVGLFIQAKNQGIGPVSLRYLALSTNFRSQPHVVEWINQHIGNLFPPIDRADDGAISYSSSMAYHVSDPLIKTSITAHKIASDTPDAEAQWVAAHLTMLQQHYPDDSIAILVRARSHLSDLLKLLSSQNIPYQSIELASLAQHPFTQDLASLTLALAFPNHALSWMSLLRSPWCGLSLQSLLQIHDADPELIWDKIQATHVLDNVIDQSHFDRFKQVISLAMGWLTQHTLADAVYKGALALSSAHIYPNDEAILTLFIQTLSSLQRLESPNDLHHALIKQAISMENPAKIQIMTIHKSKGLEFDHVILPFGHKPPPPKEHPLLMWQAFTSTRRLIISPISDKNADINPLYRYLMLNEKERNQHELIRLLYVACTRAKKTLTLSCQPTSLNAFHPGSFAYLLQSLYQPIDWHGTTMNTGQASTRQRVDLNNLTNRSLRGPVATGFSGHTCQPQPQAYSQRLKGLCLHTSLQTLANIDKDLWSSDWIDAQAQRWQRYLDEHGCKNSEAMCQMLKDIMHKTMNDPRAQWILDNTHTSAQSEYALSIISDNKPIQIILDRTFVSDGIRWIIDFKTTPLKNAQSLPQLQAQHQAQLHRYASAMQLLDRTPIKLGLYFPDGQQWLSWDFEPAVIVS